MQPSWLLKLSTRETAQLVQPAESAPAAYPTYLKVLTRMKLYPNPAGNRSTPHEGSAFIWRHVTLIRLGLCARSLLEPRQGCYGAPLIRKQLQSSLSILTMTARRYTIIGELRVILDPAIFLYRLSFARHPDMQIVQHSSGIEVQVLPMRHLATFPRMPNLSVILPIAYA